MITWEWSGRGTRKPGAGPGRAGRGRGAKDSPGSCWGAGRGSAAPPYSGRLRTELCVRPSGAKASSDSASPIPEGRLRARPAPAPAPGAVGPTALHQGTRWGGGRPCQALRPLHPGSGRPVLDVMGLTSPAAIGVDWHPHPSVPDVSSPPRPYRSCAAA